MRRIKIFISLFLCICVISFFFINNCYASNFTAYSTSVQLEYDDLEKYGCDDYTFKMGKKLTATDLNSKKKDTYKLIQVYTYDEGVDMYNKKYQTYAFVYEALVPDYESHLSGVGVKVTSSIASISVSNSEKSYEATKNGWQIDGSIGGTFGAKGICEVSVAVKAACSWSNQTVFGTGITVEYKVPNPKIFEYVVCEETTSKKMITIIVEPTFDTESYFFDHCIIFDWVLWDNRGSYLTGYDVPTSCDVDIVYHEINRSLKLIQPRC